ncbi:hypothetical protein FDU21_05370 [Xanthomonas oryzae pv. oryzae]|nr:hypothetical protein FDU21_05370 [Xanthomonas oryzae pv. oryzae]
MVGKRMAGICGTCDLMESVEHSLALRDDGRAPGCNGCGRHTRCMLRRVARQRWCADYLHPEPLLAMWREAHKHA